MLTRRLVVGRASTCIGGGECSGGGDAAARPALWCLRASGLVRGLLGTTLPLPPAPPRLRFPPGHEAAPCSLPASLLHPPARSRASSSLHPTAAVVSPTPQAVQRPKRSSSSSSSSPPSPSSSWAGFPGEQPPPPPPARERGGEGGATEPEGGCAQGKGETGFLLGRRCTESRRGGCAGRAARTPSAPGTARMESGLAGRRRAGDHPSPRHERPRRCDGGSGTRGGRGRRGSGGHLHRHHPPRGRGGGGGRPWPYRAPPPLPPATPHAHYLEPLSQFGRPRAAAHHVTLRRS